VTRINFYKIIFLVSYWVLVNIFYLLFQDTILDYYSLSTNLLGLSYDLARSILVSVPVTILGGTAIASFEVLYFNNLLRKKPLGKTLLIKTTFYLLNIFLLTSIVIILVSSIGLDKPVFHTVVFNSYLKYINSQIFILLMIYWSVAVMTALFILQISDKLGQGVLINFLLGKYHQPKEEVFGPVLSILRTETLDEAISIENSSNYGNAAAVFTQSGGLARYVSDRASAGMIGVNIGVPVPREPFSFGGWNESHFGVGDITGKSSIGFWSKQKKITTKWNPESQINWMS